MANRKRETQLHIFLLDDEATMLEVKSQDAGMSKSEYIRNLIVFGQASETTVFTREETKQIRTELNRIGNNINQITMRINMNKQGFSEDFKILNQSYLELLSLYQQIFKVGSYKNDGHIQKSKH
ncbi:MAG: plasmid mobilization relaxosome protein MobC [Acutalibacteraceae bacterium]|nr:plasmid mobilization relaxosome protein MobC [Acutalibacteraceae bacterium]